MHKTITLVLAIAVFGIIPVQAQFIEYQNSLSRFGIDTGLRFNFHRYESSIFYARIGYREIKRGSSGNNENERGRGVVGGLGMNFKISEKILAGFDISYWSGEMGFQAPNRRCQDMIICPSSFGRAELTSAQEDINYLILSYDAGYQFDLDNLRMTPFVSFSLEYLVNTPQDLGILWSQDNFFSAGLRISILKTKNPS